MIELRCIHNSCYTKPTKQKPSEFVVICMEQFKVKAKSSLNVQSRLLAEEVTERKESAI